MDDKNDPSSIATQSDHDSWRATEIADFNKPRGHDSLPRNGKSGDDREDKFETDIRRMNGATRMDSSGHDSPPAADENKDGVAILLVANRDRDKLGVVSSLMGGTTPTPSTFAYDVSKNSGVQLYKCASPDRVIIDTTPLVTVPGRSPVAIAKRWISRNCLRRLLYRKAVVVVCVVTCRVEKTCTGDMFTYSNCWVDIFGLIFKDHKAAIMVLVNTSDKLVVPRETREGVERFVREHELSPKNITYSNLESGDDAVRSVMEECIRQKKSPQDWHNWIEQLGSFASGRPDRTKDGRRSPRWKSCRQPDTRPPETNCTHRTVMPFTVNEALSEQYGALSQTQKCANYLALADREKYGPWGPERVILFGRTGSGKSTLAQMLTFGKLDKENEVFDPSTGVRGGTATVRPGIGRGWYVLDTPGFGESENDPLSTIKTPDVEAKIQKYVRVVEGIFSHYIYVVKKDRLDGYEQILWKFFIRLFGQDIKRQFTVVVSGADEIWVEENLSDLQRCFPGCESFLCAEFPAVDEDEEVEKESEGIRTASLSQLEQKLATLNRSDMVCQYGRSARTTIRMETEWTFWDLGIERSERIKFLVRGASMVFACCNSFQRPFSELTNMLTTTDNKILIPG